ncbi:MAG: hypothetical protein Q9167_005468 [Letrouitia subvulpina]
MENGTVELFDEKNAYIPQEPQGQAFFDDGREIDLLHFVYNHPAINSMRDSPSRVWRAIDEYAQTKKYLMNVGATKAQLVSKLIAERKPRYMVELGGYVGYSALHFGKALRAAGGIRYFSLERNPKFGAVMMALVELAGLSDIVKVVVGTSAESIKRLHANGDLEVIDMMFLDHYKPAYLVDLKLSEHLRLVRPGTVLVADNVIQPGNPPYLEYVRSTVEEKKARVKTGVPETVDRNKFTSCRTMYNDKTEHGSLRSEINGIPYLIYESKLLKSFEPTGEIVSATKIIKWNNELIANDRMELKLQNASEKQANNIQILSTS